MYELDNRNNILIIDSMKIKNYIIITTIKICNYYIFNIRIKYYTKKNHIKNYKSTYLF